MERNLLNEEIQSIRKIMGLNEEIEPNFDDLKSIDDLVYKELENAARKDLEESGEKEPLDEIFLLTVSGLVLAIPGIVNGIARILKAVTDKAPPRFNLSKSNDPSHLDYVIKFSGKIDDYLDTPFKVMLKPFIKDEDKRNKVAKFLKGLTLAIMTMGSDTSRNPTILNTGRDLAGNYFTDLATSPTMAELIKKAKIIIPKLLA